MDSKHSLAKNKKSGFTLLEILLVVAAIAILAGIVIFAINPAKQLGDTRNAQRKVDVNTILNAVSQYKIDNSGDFPEGITSSSTEICKTDASSCSDLVDLSELTEDEKYLVSMPYDPRSSTDNGTGYEIYASPNGRITVTAVQTELLDQDITVTR